MGPVLLIELLYYILLTSLMLTKNSPRKQREKIESEVLMDECMHLHLTTGTHSLSQVVLQLTVWLPTPGHCRHLTKKYI